MEDCTFELTETLADDIIFAMEDQSSESLVDSQHGVVVNAYNDDCDREDEGRYYSVPQWTSEDGFNLMEEFTSDLHVPQAREALLSALHSGRGVFRNFKSVLKSYPEVEKKWFAFKNKEMRRCVNDWYNGLRESWGLEKLNQTVEETADLLHDDFLFREYRPSDAELLALGAEPDHPLAEGVGLGDDVHVDQRHEQVGADHGIAEGVRRAALDAEQRAQRMLGQFHIRHAIPPLSPWAISLPARRGRSLIRS